MLLPIALHFAIGLVEFVFQKHPGFYLKYATYFDYVRNNKTYILSAKANQEVKQ